MNRESRKRTHKSQASVAKINKVKQSKAIAVGVQILRVCGN